MMPSWAGDDYSWPQSLPASTSWNLTTLAGKIHLSRGMTDDDNYAIFLRSSLASELEVDASQSAIFLVDCADGDDSEQDSLASSVDDFCSVGEGVRAISPFSTGTTMVLDRPEDFTWDTVKCRAMCRYNNDFCLGFNIYDGNCELLTDDALNAGQGDLAWPQQSEAAQLLDCVDASKLAQCTTDQVQPYRISTNQNNPNDHAEFATSGCRVQLKTVRMGNCMGAVKDGYVYSLDVPSTNIEVFDECSALCCANDWCAGVEYIVRQNSSLHTRCNFLLRSEVAALDAYTYREVTYQQRKIKLWRSARQLTSNVADTSITCVTKPGVVSPYSDTESVYLYTGGARCTSASYSAPISASFTFNLTDGLTQAQAQAMAMSNIFQMDDEKVAFCRDYCEKHKAMCKGFMVTFGDRDTVLAKCTLYTSVKAFLDFDVNSFSQLWTNFKKLGSLFVGSVPYEADRTWNVAQLYQYIAEPERDTWHLVSSTLGQETVISSVCYARYDYTMVFQADATIASAYTPVSPRICDLETAYVLRHRTGYIGQKYQSSLLELCENICSENPLACRALMIDTSLGDCILYVNWEALSIETSPFQQLNGMSDQQTVLLNNFRFKRVCSALNFTDDQDSTTDYCANVEQDAQAVTAGISVTGANLTCYIHDEYIPPQSTTIVSFTRLYIIISVSIGVPCLFCCCLACCRPPSDQTEQRFDEEAPLVIEQAPRPHVIHKKVISKPKHHNHHN